VKKLLIILGIIVVLLAGGVAVLVANLGRIVDSKKDYILAKTETALGRDVAIDDIGVTLRGGLGVKLSGVALADAPGFSNEPFVTAKDLTVKVKLWPLISKRVEVKRLVLNEPVINVIRDENGVFNFAGIGRTAGEEPGDDNAGGKNAGSAAAAPLALAFADIDNGTLRYIDRQNGTELEVDRIDFTAENAALGKEATVEFEAALLDEEQNIRIKGTVGPVERVGARQDLEPVPLHLSATLDHLTVDQIRRALPRQTSLEMLDQLEVGRLRASIEINGKLGALEVSEAGIDAAVFGAAEPNVTVRAKAEPFDVLADSGGGLPEVRFSGRIDANPLSLEGMQGLVGAGPTAPSELALSGEASANVEFGGTPEAITLEANLDVSRGTVRYGDQFYKPAGIPMGLASRLSVAPTAAKVEKCTLTAGSLVLDASGSVDFAGNAPSIDLDLRSRPIDLATTTTMLPALATFSPGGTMKLVARARGALSPGRLPEVEGTLEIEGGRARVAQVPQPVTAASAAVKFTANSARIESARATVGRSSVRLTADAESLRPFKANYRVWSDEVYRADFNQPPKPAARPEVLKTVEVKGKLWQEGEVVHLEGAATSAAGTVSNLDYRDLTATIRSTEDRIDIDSFSAKTLGGTVQGDGAFLPKAVPPRFEINTRVRSVNLTEYFTYKVQSLPRFIEGTIDLDLELAGAGKDWQNIKSTLSGAGGAVVVRGSLLNVNIADELLSGVEQVPLVDRSAVERVRQNNPKLFSGNNTAFKDLKGDFRIDGGRIHSKGLVLETSDYSVFGEGWVSLDSELNIKTNIVFSPRTTQRLINEVSVFKYLSNDKGQLEIPVSLTGPLTRPKVSPDIDALSRKIQDSAVDAGVDKLRDQLGDEVKGLFKGLGKKKDAKQDTTKTR
jgi:uncharacterized protein involved in outer membrane biogenesis